MTDCDGELREGRRTIRIGERLGALGAGMEILAVEGFRSGAVEERVLHERRDELRVGLAGGGELPVLVEAQAATAQDEIVEQGACGPVSKAITHRRRYR